MGELRKRACGFILRINKKKGKKTGRQTNVLSF